ncbi:DUF6603 domain-containing protein [Nocardia sp. CA-119907]|uniref:DUF6603 domain-containing protein n=1 Tax=Nocardia sp. CA-119907 TaxID=3239973 RepID=UPI003D955A12
MERVRITGTDAQLAALRERDDILPVSGGPDNNGAWWVIAYLHDGVRAELLADGLTVSLLADAQTVDTHWSTARDQVAPGPVPDGTRIKGEFSVELLLAAVTFARTRFDVFAMTVLRSPEALAAKLGAAGRGTEIAVEYDSALTDLDVFFGSLDAVIQRPTMDSLRPVLTFLAGVIDSLDKAAVKLGGSLTALLGDAFGVKVPDTGVLNQLSLATRPGALSATGGLIKFTVSVNPPTIVGLSVEKVELVAGLKYRDGAAALSVTVTVTGLRIAIPGAGKLMSTIGIAGSDIAADLTVGVDTAAGLTVAGGSRGRIALPARDPKGPIQVKGLALEIGRDGDRIILDLFGLVVGQLGPPLRLTVDGAGLRVVIDPAGAKPIQLPTPKLPTGLGIALDAGPVRGGGYLEIKPVPGHPDWTRYGGALQLRIGPIDVKAFGVITDRPDGFAMVVVMSVEFSPPIELGLLFSLNGIGGIVGVEVAADTDALLAGLRTGILSRLLFPADPIGSAPAILDSLAAVFPPRHGGFVIGPMVKLGWGRPISFVTAELALILSVPDPKVLLLGRVRLAVPAPNLALIDLRADVYGEFSADRVLVIACLSDSRIGFFPIGGDIGLLLRFGDDPTFVLSAGGFHPRYQPPAELAGLHRLSADLSASALFRLRVEAYTALTTNSVQFGGRLELAYGVGGTGVYGHLALDALIRFAPAFGFEVDVSAAVAVRAFGVSIASVSLALRLAGPAPWLAHGTGTVGLPWPLPDVSIDVGPIRWGEEHQDPPPLVSPRKLVRDALGAAAAWRAAAAPGREPPVRLHPDPATTPGVLVVEPWSLLQGTQSAVPLDTDIVRVGGSRVAEQERRIGLGTPFFVDGLPSTEVAHSPVPDRFAIGQYLDLPEDQQLRRPAFETFPAGIRIDPQGIAETEAQLQEAELRYETSFPHRARRRKGVYWDLLDADAAGKNLALSAMAAGASTLRTADRYVSQATPLPIAPAEHVVLRNVANLIPVPGLTPRPLTWTHAEQIIAAAGLNAKTVQLVTIGGV